MRRQENCKAVGTGEVNNHVWTPSIIKHTYVHRKFHSLLSTSGGSVSP